MQRAGSGGTTNRAFCFVCCLNPTFCRARWISGGLTTGPQLTNAPSPVAHVALVRAAIDAYWRSTGLERRSLSCSCGRGDRWHARDWTYHGTRYEGQTYRFQVQQLSPNLFRSPSTATGLSCQVQRRNDTKPGSVSASSAITLCASLSDSITSSRLMPSATVFLAIRVGFPRARTAVVVSLDVPEGQVVPEGQRLAVLEVMKMELPISAPAPCASASASLRQCPGVSAGSPLFAVEPVGGHTDAPTRRRIQSPRAWTWRSYQ